MKNSSNKILLILDLDETLIHAREEPLNQTHSFKYEQYYVYVRPYLSEFLNSVRSDFQLAIWSSADDMYVENIIRRIKIPKIEFDFIWGKSKCTLRRNFEIDQYVHEKQLKKLKKRYSIDRILVVDDSPEKLVSNYGNAIYIQPFEGDQSDDELLALSSFLHQIKEISNVRKTEKRGWRDRIEK
jgi:TFIIF-interacting CTD phosphatase-like protein